ncbi:tail fiber assembly protein [Aeromonas hydrophila]|uniref:tail fiber assembly protein n=1 Tax=Aeromonas hydrophila TaxID=644 RepID=UPI001FF1A545|nr:tail fiber assembly protein [Aeromonas hydrophila]MCK0187874.1 tail fiber assembly protein [Aeromonas hydrophila]UOV94554.1 tail fiber assembly protein [Aeromonas hydrophila]
MGYYYSFRTKGFYNETIGDVPDDAVELCDGDYDKLLAGLSNMMDIVDVDGYPTLKERAAQSDHEKASAELNSRMTLANQQISILKPAVDSGYAKPGHTQLLADWQRCRYELTLVPDQPGWPEKPQWPAEPEKVI